MDSKTRIAVAKELLKLAKSIKSQESAVLEVEDVETEKLLKQNPQLMSGARRMMQYADNVSDMLTMVLMAMKLRRMPMADINKAFTLLRPLLKRIV